MSKPNFCPMCGSTKLECIRDTESKHVINRCKMCEDEFILLSAEELNVIDRKYRNLYRELQNVKGEAEDEQA